MPKQVKSTMILIDTKGSVKLCSEAEFNKTGLDGDNYIHTWRTQKDIVLALFGKTKGRAGLENKYEFPPPADKTLLFGKCVLKILKNGLPFEIDLLQFQQMMDELHGGFDDVGSSSENETEEEESEYSTVESDEGLEQNVSAKKTVQEKKMQVDTCMNEDGTIRRGSYV